MKSFNEILNTIEVVDIIKRSPGSVRNLVFRRTTPFRKVRGRLIFLRSKVMNWIEKSPGVRLGDLESLGRGETQ